MQAICQDKMTNQSQKCSKDGTSLWLKGAPQEVQHWGAIPDTTLTVLPFEGPGVGSLESGMQQQFHDWGLRNFISDPKNNISYQDLKWDVGFLQKR